MEKELLDQIIYLNFTHVDIKDGVTETDTKSYRFHAHAFKSEFGSQDV